MKPFWKSFLLCLSGWVYLIIVAGGPLGNSSDPAGPSLAAFELYTYRLVATWWFLILIGSLVPALVWTALQANYQAPGLTDQNQ